MKNVYRQGDVCLILIDKIPKDAIAEVINGNDVVLAYGEVTGHRHRFEFRDTSHDVKLYAGGGNRYLHVTAPCALLHEEHSTAIIQPGSYLLPAQVEYSPAELVRVVD